MHTNQDVINQFMEQANEHHTPNNQIYCWDICFRSKLLSQMQLSIRVNDLKRSQFATWEPTSNQQRHSSTHATQHVTHQDQRKALLKAKCYEPLRANPSKKKFKENIRHLKHLVKRGYLENFIDNTLS